MKSRSRQRIWMNPATDCAELRKITQQFHPEAQIMGKCPKPKAIMLTHGEGYSTLEGKSVSPKQALTFQQDLFVRPQEDGLFPGHSQTWRAEG